MLMMYPIVLVQDVVSSVKLNDYIMLGRHLMCHCWS